MLSRNSPAGVDPAVGLVLLEALRSTDTPAEVLEAEDFEQSLPRRLGLSDVIERQIRKYEEQDRQGQNVRPEEIEDLFRLVSRRPDSEAVYRQAGKLMARRSLDGGPPSLLARAAPGLLRRSLALRGLTRIARRLNPGSEVRTERSPASLVVEGSLPARACESPEGCGFLLLALEEYLAAYGVDAGEPVHPLCEARGDTACVWRLARGEA